MGIVASLSRERSQDGDLAKGGAAQEGDPSNPPPITESPQPLHEYYEVVNNAVYRPTSVKSRHSHLITYVDPVLQWALLWRQL